MGSRRTVRGFRTRIDLRRPDAVIYHCPTERLGLAGMLRVTHQRLADTIVTADIETDGCSLPRPTSHIATVTRVTPSRKVVAGPGVSLYTCHGVYSFVAASCSHPQTHVSLLHGGESEHHIWTRSD